MTRHRAFYDTLLPIYSVVSDGEFTTLDIPKEFRRKLQTLISNGYLLEVGKKKVRFDSGRFVYMQQYRIAHRYLEMIQNEDY